MRLFFRCSAFFSALPARVALLPGVDMRPAKSYRCVCTSEDFMANDSHQRAAEFHELAAHAHRVAAMHHGKEDHQTAHEHSKEALEYSNKAHQRSEEAIKKSANTAV